MTTETMTIHEALSELKMLDKRIYSKINERAFCAANKHSNQKINGISIDDIKSEVKARYASITDLINRRAAIRNALSLSNATTKVIIGDTEYTVAEAIEMKKSGIENKMSLLDKLREDYNDAVSTIARNNGDKLTNAADAYINGLFGSKEKTPNTDEMKKMRDMYIAQNTYDMIDPLGISDVISALSKDVDEFVAKVDAKISVSNAITTITINY